MPIFGSRPDRAFREFEEHIEELVRGVLPLPAGIKLALATKGEFGVLEFVRGGVGTSVELTTNAGTLWFSLNQELIAVREQRRRYRVRTRSYRYRLSDSSQSRAAALLRWEYDSAIGDEAQCRHHSHAKAAIPIGDQSLNLDRLHIPTGWVLIEHVLRFLFHDLGVTPKCDDWMDRLRQSETRFHEKFTSKGRAMRDLPCETLQVDEIWTFVGAKKKNVTREKEAEGWGDVWTWVAIDADTKLVPSYRVGPRDLQEAHAFMGDLSRRLRNRVQLTTDGLHHYMKAVRGAFGGEVDYAMLVKVYGDPPRDERRRYSPAKCIEAIPNPITGSPDPAKISTSYVERQNLTMRMSIRRFTRLTNAFSKKVENHTAAVSLHFAYYNYCRPHQSLGGKTPAMAAGLEDHVWKVDELIALLDAAERVPVKRGAYRKTREAKAELRGEISN